VFDSVGMVEEAFNPGRPISLTRTQVGDLAITHATEFLRVEAWVPHTDGAHRMIEAVAVAWTAKAVRVRWRTGGEDPEEHHAWVWAGAVTRRQLPGVHPTDRPETAVDRPGGPFRPRPPAPRTRPW
jgi:hypothetical protein